MNIIKTGNNLVLSTSVEILNLFENKNYNLGWDDIKGVVASEKEDFILPTKIYGDLKVAKHTVTRFNKSDKNLGVILVGSSGSGKTLTGKHICKELNLPVFFITNNQIPVPQLAEFISSIEQDVIFFFDEFEKIYPDSDKQNQFLSILDGLFNTEYKRLFLFTSNEDRISPYITNRPSRAFYKQNYNNISPEVLREICLDKELDEDVIKDIEKTYQMFDYEFNIDITMSLISEIQMFDIKTSEAFKLLNVKIPFVTYNAYYNDELISKGFETDFSLINKKGGTSYIRFNHKQDEESEDITCNYGGYIVSYSKTREELKCIVRGDEDNKEYELILKKPEDLMAIDLSKVGLHSLVV